MADPSFEALLERCGLKKEYARKVRQAVGEAAQAFSQEREYFEADLQSKYDIARKHKLMVSACVAPFVEDGLLNKRTGFEFVRASPLFEKGVPNADFLLFKENRKSGIAIFGECKTSIAGAGTLINELAEEHRMIEENIEYITDKYLGLPPGSQIEVEMVAALNPTAAVDFLGKACEESEGGFVVWGVSTIEIDEIRAIYPPKKMPLPPLAFRHRDRDLCREMASPVGTNCALLDLLPQSHPLTRLQMLIRSQEVRENGLHVTRSRLRSNIGEDMCYMDGPFLEELTGEIIDYGIRIGFLARTEETGTYKIISRGRSGESVERALKAKWLHHRCATDLEKRKKEAEERVDDEFRKLTMIPKKLFDYDAPIS